MPHRIVHIFEPLLRLLWPAPGRHRRPDRRSAALGAELTTACPPRVPGAQVLRGEEIGLVRPYLVAHERRKAQRQQARRRSLWLAVHGIDIGQVPIPEVEVTA
ncbi:hypothetical protein ABZV31_10680 [Streptomyces sp. NPDC005202]|uniref:hypothetical protein n=1 Tax=Streptomyces sp. NPDC005202 TaxID=3157021 RepID=UPI0033B59522